MATHWVALAAMMIAPGISWLLGMPLGFVSYTVLRRVLYGKMPAPNVLAVR